MVAEIQCDAGGCGSTHARTLRIHKGVTPFH
jgi:hypothetical protein